jgi:transposase-like protein
VFTSRDTSEESLDRGKALLIKPSGDEYIGWLTAYKTRRLLCRRRVAIDKTAVKINGDWCWVYAAIDADSRLILDVAVFGRRGTDPAPAFLHRLTEKHDLSETVFLVDDYGYLTAPLSIRVERSARLR